MSTDITSSTTRVEAAVVNQPGCTSSRRISTTRSKADLGRLSSSSNNSSSSRSRSSSSTMAD